MVYHFKVMSLEGIKKSILYLSTISFFAFTGCSKNNQNGSSCSTDYDCAAQELCIDQKCVGSCKTDYDCPGNLVCQYNQCISGHGNHPPASPLSSTPQEAFNGFREALGQNNLEQAVGYFSAHVQESYRTLLQQKDLGDLVSKIPPLNNNQCDDSSGLTQCEIEIDGTQYPLLLNNDNGNYHIIQF